MKGNSGQGSAKPPPPAHNSVVPTGIVTERIAFINSRPAKQLNTTPNAKPRDVPSRLTGADSQSHHVNTEVGNLKVTLENLALVAKEGCSEASKTMADEEVRKQKEKESRRKEKDLLKKEEKEAEAKRRREDEEKNTKRDQVTNALSEELTELKLKMEQEKKAAADAVKAEQARTEKAAKDAITKKEKEDKEKAVKDAKDEKDAKEKAVEDAKGPLQKFYDALEVQINKNPGRTILTPFGVSLKDLNEMGIDRKSLPGSILPTAADKKNR